MDDLISRQAAIDALRYAQHRFTVADEAGGMGTVKWSEDVIYFAAAERVLAELPPAQPRPKTGHWIYDGDQIICNRCFKAFGFISLKLTSNYCPNCGAKMIEPQESEDKE